MMGTDDLKGYVLLTDCRTALKAANARTLMCKDLRVQFCYAAPDSEDATNKLTIWYWPKMRQATTALIITWAVPPCPADTNNHWIATNGSDLYSGGMAQFAILRHDVDIFKPGNWIKKLVETIPPPASDAVPTVPTVPLNDMHGDDDDADVVFMVDDNETFAVLRKPSKDGYIEIKRKILTCVFSNFEGMYRIVSDRSLSEAVYELYIIMKVNPSAENRMKTILCATEIDDQELFRHRLVRIPITLRQSDTKSLTTLSEKMGSFWPPLGNVFTRNFNLAYFRELLANKTQVFLANKTILRAIDNFGFQYGTKHKLSAGLFCFSNCVIDASTGQIVTHKQAGYKLMHEIFAESQLSPNFYPCICPVEDDLTRLRFFRTLMHLAKKFTGINYEAFMVTLASYFCAPKFEYIQREMFGVFIKVLTSSEGSTGKTEMIKMLNALFGMNTKAMCASATDAGLYEILGKIFSCIPICVDDLKTGGEKSNKLDETIKSLYDAMVRVVYKKMRSSRCQLMVTTNHVFCPNDQPVQSRLVMQNIKKISSFDSSLLSHWRKMQSIASMLCVDILGFPINKVYVQDCIDFMTVILSNKCIGTRSSQNWGLALYFRILIQRLIPSETTQWDDMFRYMAREICRITVEYSSDAGIIDKFSNCFRQMCLRNNAMDPEGMCFGLHNLRTLSPDEKRELNLDDNVEYYALDLDHIIDVMSRRLLVKKEDFNIKGLRLMFKGQLKSEGVSQNFVKFYDKTLMLQHQKNSERVAAEEDFSQLAAENKRAVYVFIVPKAILDQTDSNEEEFVDFRSITIGYGRNFYKEITEDTWLGFKDLHKTPLYRVANEEGLWQADDWDDPDYEERQFKMVDNMANLYRPEGTIVWPRRPPDIDWAEDFYVGHASVTQDANTNRMNFERAQEEEATERANSLDRDDEGEDEDETGHDRFEIDSMIEDDLGSLNGDTDPFKKWVSIEFGTPENDNTCAKCGTVYTSSLPTMICGKCRLEVNELYHQAEKISTEDIDTEAGKRQKTVDVNVGVDPLATDSDDDSFDETAQSDDEEIGSNDSQHSSEDEGIHHARTQKGENEDGDGVRGTGHHGMDDGEDLSHMQD
jgi:hypothetical protein